MAYSAGGLTSAEITSFSNDKPMMVVQQVNGTNYPAAVGWREADGEIADADRTDAAFPAIRAYDDFGSIVTKDTSSTDTEKYFVLNMDSRVVTFDTLFIYGHNFRSIGAESVALEIANAADFGSGLIEIYKETFSGTTDTRISCFNLNSAGGSSTYSAGGTAQKYSAVQYIRIKVTFADTSASRQLEMGELFLGKRYSLQRNPDIPWNNKQESSLVTDFISKSGITKRYVMYRGQASRSFRATIAADAEISVIDGWYNDIEEGTRAFTYVETPSSSPQAMLVMMDATTLLFPLNGPFDRSLTFGMSEQAPFLSRE